MKDVTSADFLQQDKKNKKKEKAKCVTTVSSLPYLKRVAQGNILPTKNIGLTDPRGRALNSV